MLDQSKQETTIVGGMKEIEGAARSRTDGAGIKALRLSVRLPLCRSLTGLLLFGSGLFSHYVGPDDNQPVSLSH